MAYETHNPSVPLRSNSTANHVPRRLPGNHPSSSLSQSITTPDFRQLAAFDTDMGGSGPHAARLHPPPPHNTLQTPAALEAIAPQFLKASSSSTSSKSSDTAVRSKGHSFLNVFKSKARSRSSDKSNGHRSPMTFTPSHPLPPAPPPRSPHSPGDTYAVPAGGFMSPKAARILGLELDDQYQFSHSPGGQRMQTLDTNIHGGKQTDRVEQRRPVTATTPSGAGWNALRKRRSLPFLNAERQGAEHRSRFIEEGVQHLKVGPAVTTTTKSRSLGKALEMLGLPSGSKRSKSVERSDDDGAAVSLRHAQQPEVDMYAVDFQQVHDANDGFEQELPRRVLHSQPKRQHGGRKKKAARAVDVMHSIEEASHSSLSSEYRGEAAKPEKCLEAITEVEPQVEKWPNRRLRRSLTESAIIPMYYLNANNSTFYEENNGDKEDEGDNDEAYDEDDEDDDLEVEVDTSQQDVFGPGPSLIRQDPFQQHGLPSGKIQSKSPLQHIEHKLLDRCEQAMKLPLPSIQIDAATSTPRPSPYKEDSGLDSARKSQADLFFKLQQAHRESMSELGDIQRRVSGMHLQDYIGDISSSVTDDTDDGSECESLISINCSIDLDEEPELCWANGMTVTRVTPGMVKLVDIKPPKQGAPIQAGPIRRVSPRRSKSFDKTKRNAVVDAPGLRLPIADYPLDQEFRSSQYEFSREKKARLPREESQRLVNSWITSTSPRARRPYSTIDSDVLADQDLDEPPTPPMKGDNKPYRHDCVHSGHIFRAISLRNTPDEVEMNRLGVRPYLRTLSGVKQHVHIPVHCDECSEDVQDELWECEIPICHVSMCVDCATKREVEFETRAIQSRSDLSGERK